MPTLIRLVVILLVLVGLAYGGMFALVAFVEPKEKEVTIRIPARDLLPAPERDPLVRREIDTSRPVEPAAQPAPDAPAGTAARQQPVEGAVTEMPPPEAPADADDVVTLQPGVE